MAPRLRVLAGCSPETMVSVTSIVNTGRAQRISSDLFDGEVVAYIKDFADDKGRVRDSEYFSREDRQGITWSIQVQGAFCRFLTPYSADDILFGNTFDRPLKLPWGTAAVLKFMNYIDPTLEHDLQSATKPWALSPLISTMPHFVHRRIPTSPISSRWSSPEGNGHLHPHYIPNGGSPKSKRPYPHRLDLDTSLPPFPPPHSIEDNTAQLHLASNDLLSPGSDSGSSSSGSELNSPASSASSLSSTKSGSSFKNTMRKMGRKKRNGGVDGEMKFENASQRRTYFSVAKNRQAVEFGPLDVITTDFCYGFMNFSPSLSLQLPGGLSFDLMRYWDRQPVRFVCCERKKDHDDDRDDVPWGRIFWCVAIEMVDDEEDE